MKRRIISAAVAALVAGVVTALAANTTFFTSIGDQVFPMTPSSIGDTALGGMAPVNGVGSYTKAIPSTGFSLTFGNFQARMLLEPASTLAAGYVTFAPAPTDGQQQCVYSKSAITLFYPTANTGQTVNDAVTTLGAAGHVCYVYSKSNTTWDRAE